MHYISDIEIYCWRILPQFEVKCSRANRLQSASVQSSKPRKERAAVGGRFFGVLVLTFAVQERQ
jgi:hypothetical protein